MRNGLVLLSGGDRNAALAERVVANHAAFASRHGYIYWWHRGSMVSTLGWLPYWHKVAHLREALVRFPHASGFAWVDDDIVLTNHVGDPGLTRHTASTPPALFSACGGRGLPPDGCVCVVVYRWARI